MKPSKSPQKTVKSAFQYYPLTLEKLRTRARENARESTREPLHMLIKHRTPTFDAKTDIADDVAKIVKACMEGGFNEI